MLRIAVQSKGRLFEDTMNLLSEADIKISASKRTLLVQSSNFPIEVLYLRDDDIPQSVASGVADIGIVGENEFLERQEDAQIISRLGFSKCRLSLAIPKEYNYTGLQWFNGKKIATSYPGILRRFMNKHGIKTDIHVITGSVEISPGIGLADGIFDIVSSGSTLVSNNLREVEVVTQSEALLIGNWN
ncbi:MAG TPA: ATP phosphoribosyltransferase, partial [Prevotella sp.]